MPSELSNNYREGTQSKTRPTEKNDKLPLKHREPKDEDVNNELIKSNILCNEE